MDGAKTNWTRGFFCPSVVLRYSSISVQLISCDRITIFSWLSWQHANKDWNIRECIFSRKLDNGNWVFPTTSSYSYGRTSPRRARVPAHNCMNEWLGEPVPVSQLPGRGILKNFINKVTGTRPTITVWTRGWENPVLGCQFPGKDTFSVISLIENKEIENKLFTNKNKKSTGGCHL